MTTTTTIKAVNPSGKNSNENDARKSPTSIALFPLPVERAVSNVSGQGWKVATTVKASNIPGAGNGR